MTNHARIQLSTDTWETFGFTIVSLAVSDTESSMLQMESLSFRRLADIPAGHLMYVVSEEAPLLALRIEHPGTTSFPAALILNGDAGDIRLPLVDATAASKRCVDLGSPPCMVWDHPLDIVSRNINAPPLVPGYLLLFRDRFAIGSYYVGGGGYPMYWDLKTGTHIELDQKDFLLIFKWQLGLVDQISGAFGRMLSYPGDYGKSVAG